MGRIRRIPWLNHWPSILSFDGPALLFALAGAAQSTTTGRLTGTVREQQGGVIPRAEIVAKNARTGAEFRTVSNGSGVYEVFSVPDGSYTVSVTAQGFRTTVLRDIKVDAGLTATVDAILQVGLTDMIVVTASKYEEEVVNAPPWRLLFPSRRLRRPRLTM